MTLAMQKPSKTRTRRTPKPITVPTFPVMVNPGGDQLLIVMMENGDALN